MAKGPTVIFLLKRKRKRALSNRGFTLFEILVVMGIITALLAVAAPRLAKLGTKPQTSVRRLANLTRELHNHARMRQQNYRLAIGQDKDGVTEYWVESGSLRALPLTEEQLKNLSSLSGEEREALLARIAFSEDKSLIKSKQKLPAPLRLLSIENTLGLVSSVNGVTYVYFFGTGLAQEVAIHIGDGAKMHWTMIVDPLTGKSTLHERNVTFQELK